METRHIKAVVAKHVQNLCSHSGHNVHIDDYVCAVRNLNADFGNVRADRPHGEGNNIHRAPLHTALVKAVHGLFQFVRVDPVIGRTGVVLALAGDIGAVFHTRHVRRVGAEQVTVGPFFERRSKPRVHKDFYHSVVLVF